MRALDNPEMKPETLIKHGYRPIVSQVQADQLLRRELKQQARQQQRYWTFGETHQRDFRCLLAIKPGSWYRFWRIGGRCVLLIWRLK